MAPVCLVSWQPFVPGTGIATKFRRNFGEIATFVRNFDSVFFDLSGPGSYAAVGGKGMSATAAQTAPMLKAPRRPLLA